LKLGYKKHTYTPVTALQTSAIPRWVQTYSEASEITHLPKQHASMSPRSEQFGRPAANYSLC